MEDKNVVVQDKQILNVHSSAIHIENKVSLLSRQAWFFMLYKALPFLPNNDIFSITLKELKNAIGYNSKNNTYLKKAIKELIDIKLEWNIFDKDQGEIWGVGSLLADCEIISNTGVCEYSFSPKVKKRFINPNMYVKLNLLISKKFKSKHTLAIYCLALDYLDISKNYGEKYLSLEELRKYLGLNDDEYKLSGDLNRRIIKKAESDINKDSDMQIELIPKTEGSKDKILGFKFKMSIKKDFLETYGKSKFINSSLENKFPETFETQEPIKESPKKQYIKFESKELKSFFSKHNISITTDTVQEKLKEIQEMFGSEKLESYLIFLSKYVESEYKKGAVKNFSGFFISLIKDNTQIDNYLHEIEQESKKIESKRIKIESMLEAKIKEKYEFSISEGFENYLIENIEKIEPDFIKIVEKNITKGFAFDYLITNQNKGIIDKTLLLNYKKHIRLMLINEIRPFQKELGYKKPDFEEWKLNNINEKNLKQIKLEIEKSL